MRLFQSNMIALNIITWKKLKKNSKFHKNSRRAIIKQYSYTNIYR